MINLIFLLIGVILGAFVLLLYLAIHNQVIVSKKELELLRKSRRLNENTNRNKRRRG